MVFLFLGLLVYYASPTSFFWYLTGWAVYADAALYLLLCFSHWLNGDFQRSHYEPPAALTIDNADKLNVLDLKRLPWTLWPLIHALYEFCLIINTVVSIAFWCIEGPFMVYNRAISLPPTSIGGAIFTTLISIQHIVPFVLVSFEWWHNSIVVTTNRLWLYLLIGIAYMLMLVILERFIYPSTTIYHSMDFANAPIQASICGVIVMAVWVAASLFWPLITKMRQASS